MVKYPASLTGDADDCKQADGGEWPNNVVAQLIEPLPVSHYLPAGIDSFRPKCQEKIAF
jgi:hypothetical protein